jgi:hypothetical protein
LNPKINEDENEEWTMKRWAATTVVVLVLGGLAVGQSGPTFKDTLRWLHNASEYHSTWVKVTGGGSRLDSIEVPLENTCSHFVIIARTQTQSLLQGTNTMDLRAIDPTQISVEMVKGKSSSYLWVNTTNDEAAIRQTTMIDDVEKNTSDTAGIGLFFGDRDFSQRFAKAFRHAVELCGGKPSAF